MHRDMPQQPVQAVATMRLHKRIGMDQPLVLLVISASVGGTMMCLYSGLLLVLNRKGLPEAIRIRSYRAAAMVWSAGFFGILASLTIWQQLKIWLR